MKNRWQSLTSAVALLIIVLATTTKSLADEKKADQPQKNEKPTAAEALFARIKSLSGEWIAKTGPSEGQVQYSVRVIAGGSAVVETHMPQSPMEMITVYHLDKDKVIAKHYCMLGNQPEFDVTLGKDKKSIQYEYTGCTNLKSKLDPHMHEGVMHLVDRNNLKMTWTMWIDGKAAEKHDFSLARKKSSKKSKRAKAKKDAAPSTIDN